MEKDWIAVFTTDEQPKAWIMKTALESEGINVVMLDKTSTPYVNFVPGEIELLVHTSQAEHALEIVFKNDDTLE